MQYKVYVEVDDEGHCMAHVLDLPACMIRGSSCQEALASLPAAIRETWAWLRLHGEEAPSAGDPIELEIASTALGIGPFDPGDAAALFAPEGQPITPQEMEEAFRCMAHARTDLLALAQGVSEEFLDWRPFPGHYSLRRILRHIGNADQWYVSRIVAPETLPPEWDDDEDMPLFDFLEMERRTTIERLRHLTPGQRSAVFRPVVWTNHPDEAWTARKVLRRALEHEREHTAQLREALAARRRWLLTTLAAGRALLLAELLGLDECGLLRMKTIDNWTVKDILAHIAAWDRWEQRTMGGMAAGEEPDFSALKDIDATNVLFVDRWREQSLAAVVAELEEARSGWIAWMGGQSEEVFFRPRSYGGYDWTFTVPVEVQRKHDEEHAGQIAVWRRASGLKGEAGPKVILGAALRSSRLELLSAAGLIPEAELAVWPVCGEWTLKDLLGHVADWEQVGVRGLRLMAAGRAPEVGAVEDIDSWNAAHVEARRQQPWEDVMEELHEIREGLMAALESMSTADLQRRYRFPWGGEGTPYEWSCVFVEHDRSHALDLRQSVVSG